MGIRRRLERVEAKIPEPPPDERRPLFAPAMRALDGLIGRLDERVRALKNEPDAFSEGYDDARYGETIEEHTARVDALLAELDERDEEWRREHRPDLVGAPNEIDDHIAEIEAEIRALRESHRALEVEGEGGA